MGSQIEWGFLAVRNSPSSLPFLPPWIMEWRLARGLIIIGRGVGWTHECVDRGGGASREVCHACEIIQRARGEGPLFFAFKFNVFFHALPVRRMESSCF